MNITRFEYLLSLEKIGTMTGVAEQYFISPSAVSQCLKNEEVQLGHRIFRKENHKMVPTEAGQIYLKGARKILQIRNATMDKLNVIPKSHHSVRIAVAPMLYGDATSIILPELNAALPDTRFELLRADSRVSVAYLLNDLADFALLCSVPLKHTLLSEDILGEDQLLLVIPKAYLRGRITGEPAIADCNLIPFILLKNGTNTRNIENEILAGCHLSTNRIYEVDDHLTARNFLEEGRGATFLPASMISDQAEQHFHILTPEPQKKFNFILAYPNYQKPDKEKRHVPGIIRKAWKRTDKG
ncbi:MAG: LysR family transcriptional regulator [Lachnospiraceae bacterium]